MPRTNPTSPFLTYLLLLLALHTKFSTQLNCYDVDGSIWSNNIQCPGSQSCCADVGQCTQNRLCAKEGTLVRGPCLNAQFDDCSPLCHYSMRSHVSNTLLKGNTHNLASKYSTHVAEGLSMPRWKLLLRQLPRLLQ